MLIDEVTNLIEILGDWIWIVAGLTATLDRCEFIRLDKLGEILFGRVPGNTSSISYFSRIFWFANRHRNLPNPGDLFRVVRGSCVAHTRTRISSIIRALKFNSIY